MHNAMIENMRTDALLDLYAGYVTPLDREILADMPLPSDMVDPFASQDVDPLSVMNLTYVSLSGWIADARKEKYYSERFVSLSKLVMKGVTIMGRGLVTLHKRGEELSAAPMQIDDLISVGSYHFRKSYLGVVQFSAKHPEIGERLLVNQLGWSTTLMRLYKTKEKLASGVRSQVSGAGSNEVGRTLQNEEGISKNEEMPNGNSNKSSFLLHNSSFEKESSLNAVSALFEPGAFFGARAYSSLDRNQKIAGSKARAEEKSLSKETRTVPVESQAKLSEGTVASEVSWNGKNEPEDKEIKPIETEKENETTGNQQTKKEQTTLIRKFEEQDPGERKDDEPVSRQKEQTGNPDEPKLSGNSKNEMESQQTELIGNIAEPDSGGTEICKPEREKAEPIGKPDETGPEGYSYNRMDPTNQPVDAEPDDRDEYPSPDDGTPGYLKILQNVYARSGPSETGELTFTFDEIAYLAFDPDFGQVYPESAAEMRRLLDRIDSG